MVDLRIKSVTCNDCNLKQCLPPEISSTSSSADDNGEMLAQAGITKNTEDEIIVNCSGCGMELIRWKR